MVGHSNGLGCRSLVCDANGIIIAEMVHRCMICAHISEGIADARKHYQETHFESSDRDTPSLLDGEGGHPDDIVNGQVDEDVYEGDGRGSALQGEEAEDEEHEADDHQKSSSASYSGANGSTSSSVVNGHGHTSRGGFVTCAVCNIVKYYASVQRRYGHFTCMGCAKFFGRFLLKPKKYYCPYLGSCPLDVTPRCKACLLEACTNTYILDERRKAIAMANKPVKRVSPPASQSGPSTAATGTSVHARHNPCPPGRSSNGIRSAIQKRFTQIKRNAVQTAVQGSVRYSTPSSTSSSARGAGSASFGRSGTSIPAIRKQWGCKKCPGCLMSDCGNCNYCKDKPKFGGPNTLKKKCVNRRCHSTTNGGASGSKRAAN